MIIEEHRQCRAFSEQYPDFFSIHTSREVVTGNGKEVMLEFHLYDHNHDGERLPVFGLFAGVHGLEVIGIKILLNFIEHLLIQTQWNTGIRNLLKRVRIIGIPIVNPSGYLAKSRSNGNGVDLMRNAPVDSHRPLFFFGGQKRSRHLPFFRGNNGLEAESQAVIDIIRKEIWGAPFGLSFDLHSGFGNADYIWTPYAAKKGKPPNWPAYCQIHDTLNQSIRYHKYKFEPQSTKYCASGDLWDYLYDAFLEENQDKNRYFLPLTLEVGTWRYVWKSPISGLRLLNYFNPSKPHRFRRVIRRHVHMLTVMAQIVADWRNVFH